MRGIPFCEGGAYAHLLHTPPQVPYHHMPSHTFHLQGEWRTVTVDDRVPVDLFGQFLVVGVRPLQLWPMVLSKAVLKVMAAQRILDRNLPHQVAAFRLLTGWPQEDLLDPLSGAQLRGGFLFDRLEETLRGNDVRGTSGPAAEGRSNVGTTCLITRALPERPPPRIIVLGGPSAVGCGRLLRRLQAEFPEKFGLVVGHTTRQPKEHEVRAGLVSRCLLTFSVCVLISLCPLLHVTLYP